MPWQIRFCLSERLATSSLFFPIYKYCHYMHHYLLLLLLAVVNNNITIAICILSVCIWILCKQRMQQMCLIPHKDLIKHLITTVHVSLWRSLISSHPHDHSWSHLLCHLKQLSVRSRSSPKLYLTADPAGREPPALTASPLRYSCCQGFSCCS